MVRSGSSISSHWVSAVVVAVVSVACADTMESSAAQTLSDAGTGGANGQGGNGAGAGAAGLGGNPQTGGGGNGAGGAAAGGKAGGAGTGGAKGADQCSTSSDCSGGVCWLGLDGVKTCVAAPTTVPRETCGSTPGTMCCSDDACADGGAGRCISNIATYMGCGGAVPMGNACWYDTCASDASCASGAPSGAAVSTCFPAGALNVYTARCVYGGCRTDADCSLHPGGQCQYGEGPTHGTCDRRLVLYCAYPSDPCKSNADCQAGSCVPEENFQGRHCGASPPQYP